MGADDILLSNLLFPVLAIVILCQQGVEAIKTCPFTALRLWKITYDRIKETRDNKAGHLAIFQSQISYASIKPGHREYSELQVHDRLLPHSRSLKLHLSLS